MLTGLFASVVGWFLRKGIGTIVQQLGQARRDSVNAKTEQQKLESKERIAGLNVRLAIQQSENLPLGEITRFFIAFPFVIHINKVVLVDPIVCPLIYGVECSTDPLSVTMNTIMTGVVAFYFLMIAKSSFR